MICPACMEEKDIPEDESICADCSEKLMDQNTGWCDE